MRRMKALTFAALALMALPTLRTANAAGQDTDIAGVTAEVAFLRQYDGVLHLGVVLHNPADKEAESHSPITFSCVSMIQANVPVGIFTGPTTFLPPNDSALAIASATSSTCT